MLWGYSGYRSYRRMSYRQLSPCFGVILGIPSYRQLSPEGNPSTERTASGLSMKEMATAAGRTCQVASPPSQKGG